MGRYGEDYFRAWGDEGEVRTQAPHRVPQPCARTRTRTPTPSPNPHRPTPSPNPHPTPQVELRKVFSELIIMTASSCLMVRLRARARIRVEP